MLCLLPPGLAWARVGDAPGRWVADAQVRDLADIRRTRLLRVLINQSRHSAGQLHEQVIGLELQRAQALLAFINQGVAESSQVQLKLIPLAKDQLLQALARGEGDLVLPGERIQVARGMPVKPSVAVEKSVPLVVVTHRRQRALRSLADLAGRSLALAPGSAVRGVLAEVNSSLKQPLVADWLAPSMAVEDVLEMVHAGLLGATAVEQSLAERWQRVYPDLRIERHLQLGKPAGRHWYVHRSAPNLEALVNRFLSQPWQPPADPLAGALRKTYRLQNPLGREELRRLERVLPALMLRAKAHRLEWPLLAAIAYKESTLNPNARGSKGARGLMQVTPIAAEAVGMPPPQTLGDNIEVAARYLDQLRSRHFSSRRIDDRERMGFMLAAYNMGITRLQVLRAEARRRGLDADRWFFQVERIAAERHGTALTSYVASVNKYYQVYQRERYRLEP